jgi:hypothetical protein
MTNPQYTCLECGYDMHDRQGGDPCPECNTPLDIRKDDPVANRKTLISLIVMILAIVVMPFAGTLSALLTLYAHHTVRKRHSLISEYRQSSKTRSRRRLIQYLTYIWFILIIIMLIVEQSWPGVFNWW